MRSLIQKRTLRKSVIGVLVFTVIPIVICMFILSIISLQTIRKQIYDTSFDMLSLHINQINQELVSMQKYLLSIDYEQVYTDNFESENSEDNYFAANHYIETISPMIYMFEYVEGILIYSPKSDASVYHYNSNSNSSGFEKREKVIRFIKENQANISKNHWAQHKIEEQYVLIYVYQLNETYFCSWIIVDNLIKVADDWKISEKGVIYILNNNNEIMAQTALMEESIDLTGDISEYYFSDNNYLMLGVLSKVGDFKLMEAVDIKELTKTYERIFLIIVGILIIFFFMIPVILRSLNRTVFKPMGKIQSAINAIDNGKLDYQIEVSKNTEEFEHLIDAFNSMVRQIEHLKIETYEDKIEQNRIMLQYLQVQVEPHFYLNALNTINAMAQVGDTDLILKLTKNLSEYMRFITKTKNGTVTVKNEIEHILNYMEIIKMRLGSDFDLKVTIDQSTEFFLIPPLIIQNLVENIIKYAFDVYEKNIIIIEVKAYSKDNIHGIWISVEDNGNGYPKNIIDSFNNEDDDHLRIGLENTKKRLYYMFGNRAEFQIGNKPEGGAKAQISILNLEDIQGGDKE